MGARFLASPESVCSVERRPALFTRSDSMRSAEGARIGEALSMGADLLTKDETARPASSCCEPMPPLDGGGCGCDCDSRPKLCCKGGAP